MNVFKQVIHVIFLCSLFITYASAQSTEDTAGTDVSYYLVDRLPLSQLQDNERRLIDSCLAIYHSNAHDTVRLEAIGTIVEESWDENVWPKYNEWLYEQTKSKLKNEKHDEATTKFLKNLVSGTVNNIGYLHSQRGQLQKALEYYNESLQMRKELNNKKEISLSYNNIGGVYESMGNLPEALRYYLKSLTIKEQIDDEAGMATVHNNIALLHFNQHDFENAIHYYLKGIETWEKMGQKRKLALGYNNIGLVYKRMLRMDTALLYYSKALTIYEEERDESGLGHVLNNIGGIHNYNKDYEKALEYYGRALDIFEKIGFEKGISYAAVNIGGIKLNQGNVSEARHYGTWGMKLANELGFPALIHENASLLSKVAAAQGNWQQAYDMRNLEISMRDSIENERNVKATAQQEARYKYEKKALADSIAYQKEQQIKEAEIAQQKAEIKAQKHQQYALFGGIGLVLVFSVFMYNRYRVTRQQKALIAEANEELNQQNEEIAAQRDQIEEQRDDMIASINYAKRIQDALLKNEQREGESYVEHFILFKPKDIVSGDFYWSLEKEGHLYIAAVDCTGHGVPGAFLTMLGTSFLNEISSAPELLSPAAILDQLRNKVITALSNEGDTKDGMDISLLRIRLDTREIQWAGANNPLYVLREKEGEKQIDIVKGDREPIGYTENPTPFTNHTLQLAPGDQVYIFSDGYADQFGGDEGKKIGYKKFRTQLMETASKPAGEQYGELLDFFQQWRGTEEQVDDVCLIGLRV